MLDRAVSLLYVPGDRPELFPKALASGADVIILDLEDAVLPAQRPNAREAIRRWLADQPQAGVAVRCSVAELDQDVALLADSAVAVVLPELTLEVLARFEELWGPAHPPKLLGLIESAVGLTQLQSLAQHPWISRLGLGEADLAADLGMAPDSQRSELFPFRAQLVLHSRAAAIAPPVGPVFTNVKDLEGLGRTSAALRRQGYGGRTAIHPGQIPTIHTSFAPTPEAIATAKEVLAAFQAAADNDRAVAQTASGELIDPATIRWASRLLGSQ